MRIINKYMNKNNIDFVLQGKIRSYLDFDLKEASLGSSKKEQMLIERLSIPLRKELLHQANGKILMTNSLLKNNFSLDSIQKLTEQVVFQDFGPGDYVYEVFASN
jgi:hypothetical protein